MLHTLLYFLALLSLSTSSIWAKLNQMPASVLGFWRLSLASLLLGLFVFAVKKTPWPKLEKKLLWVVLSGAFFFAHLWSYKYAAKHTLIANMMILFATNPLWTTIGSVLFFKEKLSRSLWLAYIFAAFAVAILVHKQFQFGGESLYGDLAALSSAFFFACYMLSGKSARAHYSNLVYASIQYATCAVLFLLAALINNETFTGYSEISWIAVMGQIVFPTFLGHFISTYLMSYMKLSVMSCGKLIEPVIAAVIAYFLFQEGLTFEALIAFIFTALSLLILFAPQIINSKKASNP